MQIDEILDNFEFLDDWEDRYRYLIELGRTLEPLPQEAHNAANKVQGCASQVWLETRVDEKNGQPVLRLVGDSDAHIVRGLIALLIALLSGRTARDVLATELACELPPLREELERDARGPALDQLDERPALVRGARLLAQALGFLP